MKTLITIMLFVLLLSSCAQSTVLRPTKAPAVAVPPDLVNATSASNSAVKVVEMATQTPVVIAYTHTPDPSLPTPTRTPIALFPSFASMGIQTSTYRDEVSGLAFDYPSDWILTAPSEEDKKNAVIYSITLRSASVTTAPKQQDGIPPGVSAIDMGVFKQGPKTLEQAINERRASATTTESGQPVQIVLEEEWDLPGGLKAYRFLFNLGPDAAGGNPSDRMSSELVTIIDGRMVLVSGLGDMSMFNVIAASLRESK